MSRTDDEIRADLAHIASLDWVSKYDEDRIHRLAADVPGLLVERDAALDECERLRAALVDAADEIDSWGGYSAGDYFREKWHLQLSQQDE
jgi:phage gp36-like protein